MTSQVRYYKDAATFVDLTVTEYSHDIDREVTIHTGNAGANTYGDDVRYTHRWEITAVVGREDAGKLRDYVDETFAAATVLRVYDLFANPFYTDYASVKLKHLKLVDLGGMQKFRVTLTVVK